MSSFRSITTAFDHPRGEQQKAREEYLAGLIDWQGTLRYLTLISIGRESN